MQPSQSTGSRNLSQGTEILNSRLWCHIHSSSHPGCARTHVWGLDEDSPGGSAKTCFSANALGATLSAYRWLSLPKAIRHSRPSLKRLGRCDGRAGMIPMLVLRTLTESSRCTARPTSGVLANRVSRDSSTHSCTTSLREREQAFVPPDGGIAGIRGIRHMSTAREASGWAPSGDSRRVVTDSRLARIGVHLGTPLLAASSMYCRASSARSRRSCTKC